jgi:nicotinamide mononucleotide transporter
MAMVLAINAFLLLDWACGRFYPRPVCCGSGGERDRCDRRSVGLTYAPAVSLPFPPGFPLPDLLAYLFDMAWLEFLGLVSGLLCVWLLIRENILTFPIGLVYAVISVVVFIEARLYADVLLNGYYVLMNAYGWYYWRFNDHSSSGTDRVPVTFAPALTRVWLLVLVGVSTVAMGWILDNRTDADLAYWDSATTTLSFAAMWMTARKYIDSWAVWLVVDVIATGIYIYKGIEFYAVLYGLYLIMAIMGWQAWRRSMKLASSSA